jgi:hypothetical protein
MDSRIYPPVMGASISIEKYNEIILPGGFGMKIKLLL